MAHVVQQDAIDRQRQRLAQLIQVGHFDFDGPVSRIARAHPAHRLGDGADRRDVVVLDQRHVERPDAVVAAAAQPHRPLVQQAQPRTVLRVSRITARAPATAST